MIDEKNKNIIKDDINNTEPEKKEEENQYKPNDENEEKNNKEEQIKGEEENENNKIDLSKEKENNNNKSKDKEHEILEDNLNEEIINKENEEIKNENDNKIDEIELDENNKNDIPKIINNQKEELKENSEKNEEHKEKSIDKEIKNTEEFLENNLSHNAFKTNKYEEKKENSSYDENKELKKDIEKENYDDSLGIENPNEIRPVEKKNTINSNSRKSKQKEEIIFVKQIIPINYINKIRHRNLKINNIIPKKKRIFITKIINPKKDKSKNEENIITEIPASSICYLTKNPLIQGKMKYLNSVSNDYCFYTKLNITKEKTNKTNNINLNKINVKKRLPCKIYKKTIVSPKKGNLFRTNKKPSKIKKHRYDYDNNNDINNNEGNLSKRVRKSERISLISKDLDVNSSQKEDQKEIRNNNNQLVVNNNNFDNNMNNNNINDNLEENRIDISIQFSNSPININSNYSNNNPNLIGLKDKRKFNSAFKKGNKNFVDSLYRDLREINNKLENRNDYFKKHHYHLNYPKHVGDEANCPICKEVRKKGKIMEKEKGLFNALNFKNYKTINRKSLNKLKLANLKKVSSINRFDLLSDEERKKNNMNSLNNLNSLSQQNLNFKKKYMQFNGMNRLQRFNRYGSVENYKILNNNYLRNDSKEQNFNNGKLYEQNDDIFNNSEFPLLKNYFHDDNVYKTNNYL